MELVGLISGVIGTLVALITLALVLLRGALTSERRITALETKIDLFWNAARGIVADALQGKAPQNPIDEPRWAYLLDQFRSNQLTPAEANELHNGFLEKERKAKEQNDLATLLVIGLGLALLAVLLGRKG